jgi:hypothetical protein
MPIREGICWGQPRDGLMLGLAVRGAVVEFYLKNVGSDPLDVLSHVSADIDHLDWYELRMVNQAREERVLRFIADRDKSGTVKVHLLPGESTHHSVNLREWAKRPINSSENLTPGEYELWATYKVPTPSDTWTGRLEAGPVTTKII